VHFEKVLQKMASEGALKKTMQEDGSTNGTDRKLQLVIVLMLLVPWVVASISLDVGFEEIGRQLYESLRLEQVMTDFSYLNDEGFFTTATLFSLPHVTYFIVWTNAEMFYNFAKSFGEPFRVFAFIAHAIKMVQLAVAVRYFGGPEFFNQKNLEEMPGKLWAYAQSINVFQAILGTELFILGQIFNSAVYSTIGENGVYYGCRLKKEVPWVHGFPFSVVPHPQYLGATISIWGGVLLFVNDQAVAMGSYAIGAIFSFYYFFSSMVEQYL